MKDLNLKKDLQELSFKKLEKINHNDETFQRLIRNYILYNDKSDFEKCINYQLNTHLYNGFI